LEKTFTARGLDKKKFNSTEQLKLEQEFTEKKLANDKLQARALSDLEMNFTSQSIERRKSQKVDLLSMNLAIVIFVLIDRA
jgi:hypothetical protein